MRNSAFPLVYSKLFVVCALLSAFFGRVNFSKIMNAILLPVFDKFIAFISLENRKCICLVVEHVKRREALKQQLISIKNQKSICLASE